VAWSLKDHSEFFRELKQDFNIEPLAETPSKISTQDVQRYALRDSLPDYSSYIDLSIVQAIVDDGVKDDYWLKPGDLVHLGYQVTDIHGPTILLRTADTCANYAELSADIKYRCMMGTLNDGSVGINRL